MATELRTPSPASISVAGLLGLMASCMERTPDASRSPAAPPQPPASAQRRPAQRSYPSGPFREPPPSGKAPEAPAAAAEARTPDEPEEPTTRVVYSIEPGPPRIRGPLDHRGLLPRLRNAAGSCAERVRLSAEIRAVARLRVAGNGRVSDAQVDGTAPADLLTCISDTLRRISFSPAPEATEITAPFRISVEEVVTGPFEGAPGSGRMMTECLPRNQIPGFNPSSPCSSPALRLPECVEATERPRTWCAGGSHNVPRSLSLEVRRWLGQMAHANSLPGMEGEDLREARAVVVRTGRRTADTLSLRVAYEARARGYRDTRGLGPPLVGAASWDRSSPRCIEVTFRRVEAGLRLDPAPCDAPGLGAGPFTPRTINASTF